MLVRKTFNPSFVTHHSRIPVYRLTTLSIQRYLQRNLISSMRWRSTTYRFSSTSATPLSFMPHAFSTQEAAKRFVDADSKRLFSPIIPSTSQLALSDHNPMTKALIPLYGVNASITHTKYFGEYGIEHTLTTYNEKGESTTQTYTTWHSITGTLGSISYTPESENMCIYAGYTWGRVIEEAMDRYKAMKHLQPFEAKSVESDVFIDPYLMRSAIAQEIANKRVNSAEDNRIRQDIRNRVYCDDVRVNRYSIQYDQFHLSSYMLPAYVLQYPNATPRILPALFESDNHVYGAAQVSITKCMAASAVTTSILAAMFPQFAIPARLATIAVSSLVTGMWARYRLGLKYRFQERKLKASVEYNDTVSESIADKARFEATSRNFTFLPKSQVIGIDPEFYNVMGLDPNKLVTKEAVQQAFHDKIKKEHPDQGGSEEAARKLLEARDGFMKALAKKEDKKAEPGKRFFSTLARQPIRVKEPPRSVFDPNASLLITTVLDKKDYKKALELVTKGVVHPDGHDAGENTLLTEAVRRGSVEAIRFTVDTLKASVDTSCDCPHHNTALHYAAKIGREDATNFLLDRKANPNLINALGQTPRDLANAHHHVNVEKALISRGGQLHRALPGSSGSWVKFRGSFFKYGSHERTLLLKKQGQIYLPSPAKK